MWVRMKSPERTLDFLMEPPPHRRRSEARHYVITHDGVDLPEEAAKHALRQYASQVEPMDPPEDEDLSGKTVVDLKRIAKERGVNPGRNPRKDDLIEALS